MNTGGGTSIAPVSAPAHQPTSLRSDGSAAAEFRADINALFANGKIDDYLSGDRERVAKAHGLLIYSFHKIGSAASSVDFCVRNGLYNDPRMAATLKHLIEGFVGTDDRTILLLMTRRLKARAHPDKTAALLDGMNAKQKAIVGQPIWELYNSILGVVSNKAVLDALYGAASHAHEYDAYEPATGATTIVPPALRRWLRQPRFNPLAPWRELAAVVVAIVVGIVVGAAAQALHGNPVLACITGVAAGGAAYMAMRALVVPANTQSPLPL